MKSGLSKSVRHLENTRQSRLSRIRRLRAIEVGKPATVSLRRMALNSAQQKKLSNLRVRPQVHPKHRIMTPKRVSVMVALGLHLIAVMLASYSIVWPTRLDAEAKDMETIHFIPARNLGEVDLRRLPPDGAEDPLDPIERGGCPIPNPEPIHDVFKPTEILRSASFHYKAEPKYPSEAKRAGKEGKVVLEATIDAAGKVKDITVKEDTVGFGCARAAIQALKASRFNPAKRGGETVAIRIAIPYQFTLEDEADRANRQRTRVEHRSPRTPTENDSAKLVEAGCW